MEKEYRMYVVRLYLLLRSVFCNDKLIPLQIGINTSRSEKLMTLHPGTLYSTHIRITNTIKI